MRDPQTRFNARYPNWIGLPVAALKASSTPRADLFDVVEEIFQAGYLSGQEVPTVEPVDGTYDLLTESDLAAVGESACYGELS